MAMVVHRSRGAGLVFGLGRTPALGDVTTYSGGGVQFTGTYNPAFEGQYMIAPGQEGAFDAARSAYEIQQLQAAGATNIQWDPYARKYVDAATTQIYNDAGTGSAAPWTDADQSALDQRIQTIVNDPTTAPAIKTLVQMPGYGTPEFDAAVNNGTDTLLTSTVNNLLATAQTQAPATVAPTGEAYLVGGVEFYSMADAVAAQTKLAQSGETLLPAAKERIAAAQLTMTDGGDASGGGGFGGGGSAFGMPDTSSGGAGALLAGMPGGLLGVAAIGLAIFAATSNKSNKSNKRRRRT